MEDRVEQDEPTQTTADGLTRLATSIVELLGEQAIDSRLGAKLLKRLEKEAKLVEESGPQSLNKAQKRSLRDALDGLEHAVRQVDANLLVSANAKLRSTDESSSKKAKTKSKVSWSRCSSKIGLIFFPMTRSPLPTGTVRLGWLFLKLNGRVPTPTTMCSERASARAPEYTTKPSSASEIRSIVRRSGIACILFRHSGHCRPERRKAFFWLSQRSPCIGQI